MCTPSIHGIYFYILVGICVFSVNSVLRRMLVMTLTFDSLSVGCKYFVCGSKRHVKHREKTERRRLAVESPKHPNKT